ncbi:hypothetical protein BPIT_14740 [Candidatus Brocadia pituitae]|nr:hypothetical protein BPIT_14740 [Candidatus Brocadia pituitae]
MNGGRLATLYVNRNETFSITLLAGERCRKVRLTGRMVSCIYTPLSDSGPEEIHYRVLNKNEMEWTDQKGNVKISQRQYQ